VIRGRTEGMCVCIQLQTICQAREGQPSQEISDLQETFTWVDSRTPGFTNDFVEHIIRSLASPSLSEREIQQITKRVARYDSHAKLGVLLWFNVV
jgi:hypothetical protein